MIKPLTAILLALLLATAAHAEVVDITSYSPEVAQCDSTPLIARCGRVRPWTVALSRDLWRRGIKCGQVVTLRLRRNHARQLSRPARIILWVLGAVGLDPPRYVEHDLIAWDSMNARWRGRVDLFSWDKERALAWGKRRGHLVVERRK